MECPCCGYEKMEYKRDIGGDRIYECPECGTKIGIPLYEDEDAWRNK